MSVRLSVVLCEVVRFDRRVFCKVSYFSACSQRCGRSTKRKDSSREKGRGLEDEPEKDDSDAPSPCSC
ncbi:GM14594 [Drosophila sechellia]|uniref:GM14594 n=1 Tax=Drosophila sechellia TaxID=7238 RepID=B4HTV2_DROSE|nr:GM14594 [Drosophila sechellia]